MATIIRNGVRYGGGGSGNTKSIEMTRAEWEALGDEKYSNDITYFITDGVTSGGSGDGESTLGGTGEVYMRYVNDPNDENFDWVQVQDAEGNWINDHRAYTQRYELYVDQNNGGEFAAMALTTNTSNTYEPAAPTVTFVDGIVINTKASSGGVISKLLDLSRFNKIKFHHYSEIVTRPSNESYSAYVKFFICQSKVANISPIVLQNVLINSTFNEGDIEIDISSLNGEYYIGFDVYAYGSYNTETKITNFYME